MKTLTAAAVLMLTPCLAVAGPRPTALSPSLEGVWTNASYTQFERPDEIKGLIPTPQEAKTYEARLAKTGGVDMPPERDPLGQVESENNDAGDGLARIRGQLRSSWIVSPVDGKIAYTEEARRRFRMGPYKRASRFDNPEDRPDSERCLDANGATPPQMSAQDTNHFQIVQTKDHIALASEKNHDVRTVFLNVARRVGEPPSWTGNSYGRWEGPTLVVETQGFQRPVIDRSDFKFSGDARFVERFTRTGADEIFYEFTIFDPLIFVEPVRGEMVFKRAKGRPFEYACHEGNYSLPSILQAARLGKQTPPPKPAAPPPAKPPTAPAAP